MNLKMQEGVRRRSIHVNIGRPTAESESGYEVHKANRSNQAMEIKSTLIRQSSSLDL